MTGEGSEQFPPVLLASSVRPIVLLTISKAFALAIPPPELAELPATVMLAIANWPLLLKRAPPWLAAELPDSVLLLIVNVINNGMVVIGLPRYVQDGVLGVLVIIAVVLSTNRRSLALVK